MTHSRILDSYSNTLARLRFYKKRLKAPDYYNDFYGFWYHDQAKKMIAQAEGDLKEIKRREGRTWVK